MNHLVWQVPMQTGSTRTGVSPQASPLGGHRADVWSGRSPGYSQKYLLHPSQGSSLSPSPTDQRCRNGVSARARYHHGHSPLHHLLPEETAILTDNCIYSDLKVIYKYKVPSCSPFFCLRKNRLPPIRLCLRSSHTPHLSRYDGNSGNSHTCPHRIPAFRICAKIQEYLLSDMLISSKSNRFRFCPRILEWSHIMGDNPIWESAAAVGLTPAQESSWSVWPLTLCSPLSRHSRWLWSWQKDPLEELWGRDNLQVHKNKHSSHYRSRD